MVVDLGTGAGFPGVPLAILRPAQRFILVEARRRRVTFLRELRRTLELGNVIIMEQRAEEPPPEYRHAAGAVVMRAVSADESMADIACKWLAAEGRFFWMRTDCLARGVVRPPFVREQPLRYRIGRDRARCVEVLRFRPEKKPA
jgi:16S rRNA (guanine(527)-N(7))-methyltransferase RsmG